jgi:LPPG:FO 2-phospho-L-lactate transferase
MRITALAGGIGGARFLRGLLAHLDERGDGPHEVTVVGNTGDDVTLHGLRICPDLDTVMYTLGDGINEEQGWGRRAETWSVKEELALYDAPATWFGLGDRDIATHLIRTQMLDAGFPLSEITRALCERWQPGVRLIPMSDERVETHVVVADPDEDGRKAIHFQEWWIKHRAALPAQAFVQVGAERALAAPGVIEAITHSDVVLFPPSNPIVSIGAILSVQEIRDAVSGTSAPVVGVSPIIGGAPVRGMADACLTALGIETSAQAVAEHYGARSHGGLIDGWLIAPGDTASIEGLTVRTVPLLMSDPATSAELARETLELALSLR